MKKKLKKLAVWCFGLAVGIFALDYVLFHYLTAEGLFTAVFQQEAGKPFVTLLVGIWGVMFLFAGIMSLLVGWIFYGEEK